MSNPSIALLEHRFADKIERFEAFQLNNQELSPTMLVIMFLVRMPTILRKALVLSCALAVHLTGYSQSCAAASDFLPAFGFGIAFPEGRCEAYWTAVDESRGMTQLFVQTFSDASGKSRVLSIPGAALALTAPFFMREDPDRLFFSQSNTAGGKGRDLYRSKRLSTGWSVPEKLSISSDSMDYYGSFSRSGNLYFSSARKGNYGRADVYVAKYRDDNFSQPINLGKSINGGVASDNPAISPDETFLIFCHQDPSRHLNDICVSFRISEGDWTLPIKLGPVVNTDGFEFAPYISNDGRFLFFTRVAAGLSRTTSGFFKNEDYQFVKIPIAELALEELREKARLLQH